MFVADSVPMTKCLLYRRANLLAVPSDHRVVDTGSASAAMTLTVLQHVALQDRMALSSEYERWGGDVALTPMHTAAGAGKDQLVKFYLDHGVFVDTLGEYYDGVNQRTPLHWAAVMGRSEVIRILLEHGANPNALDRSGRSPLHWAARSNNADSVHLLVEAGADPSLRDYEGKSAIFTATEDNLGNEAILKTLVAAGADINAVLSSTLDTPLHLAMKKQYQRAALALLHTGADMKAINSEGHRPVECTVSAELQFRIKKEAGANDVYISYTPAYHMFAQKIQQGIESNFITTCNAKLGEASVETSVMVSILSKDYEKSEDCLNELACAKQLDIPVIGIFCDRSQLSEELQVYLYTRQIVPFANTIQSIDYSSDKHIKFSYFEDKFNDYLRCLLDGLRDEIELRRLAGGQRRLSNHPRLKEDAALSSNLSLSMKASSHDIPVFGRGVAHVFLSHGDCHADFVAKLYRNLAQNGINVFLDTANKTCSLKERIVEAKDAILCCSVFMVILSKDSVKTPLVSDQLAYAEDKDKPIIPIIYEQPAVDTHIQKADTVILFSQDLGLRSKLDYILEQSLTKKP